MIVRKVSSQDWPAVEALLRACDLPIDGARQHLAHFMVCEDGTNLRACAGAEVYGDVALLRSVAVREDARGLGLGDKLTTLVLAELKARNVTTVALLTTTAEHYFAKRGFRAVERTALPTALAESAELKGACPATAIAMLLHL